MKYVTIDFETFYDTGYTLKKLTTEEYINDPRFQVILVCVRDIDGVIHTIDSWDKCDEDIGNELKGLGVADHPVLAHNTAFDGAILSWKYQIVPPLYLDTMSMARPILFPKIGSVGLGDIGVAFKGVIGFKGDEVASAMGMRRDDFTDEALQTYANYCKQDVAITSALFQLMVDKFTKVEMIMIDRTIRMYTVPGLYTDRRQLKFGLLEVQKEHEDALASVSPLGVNKAVLMSNPRFAKALEEFGAVPPTKVSPTTGRETFAFSKADEEFTRMAYDCNANVAALVKARLIVKSTIQETRMKRLIDIHDRMWGKLPVPLKYYGAMTGRFSGWDGINMQNPPKSGPIRAAMKPRPGNRLIAADQAQIEARFNACFSGQLDMLQQFRDGEDVYAHMASTIYGMPITKEEYPDERFVGKTAILGCGYGVGPERFFNMLRAAGVDCDQDFAEKVVRAYRGKYKAIVNTWYRANDMLDYMISGEKVKFGCCTTSKGKMVLPNGMWLSYNGLYKTGTGRDTEYYYKSPKGAGRFANTKIYGAKLIENIMQALTRILMTDHLVKISMVYEIVLQMHDELVLSVPTPEVGAAKIVIRKVMETRPVWMPEIPLDVEIMSGGCYADCK